MRSLLLMRGAPGCGKSTWIKNHNLEEYTLSPDNIRLLCSSPKLNVDGTISVSQEDDNYVWNTLFEILKHRMEKGEFTVIDATCSKTTDITRFKKIAQEYRYRMYIVDFTIVPIEVCKRQNKMRNSLKVVPDKTIDKMYARFASQEIPSGVKIIEPNQFDSVLETPIDLSEYEKIIHIGDIHGCYDTLMQYFQNGINPNYNYIFCGDYIDRGDQNAEVLEFLYSIKDLPNVSILTGNHERWIYNYGKDLVSNSKVFENVTKKELISKKFSQKKAKMLYQKMRQVSHYLYNGIEVLASHAGIPTLENNLLYRPTNDFIKGVGNYEDIDKVHETWKKLRKENQYQVHGHRNIADAPIDDGSCMFNLEGNVEFGGKLRIIELDKNLNWKPVELDNLQKNKCQFASSRKEDVDVNPISVEEALEMLKNDKYVEEKDLGDNISSFNFTRDAFASKAWNYRTILARGLFIDTLNAQIIARSYNKFFNIDEMPETQISNLRRTLEFPIYAYKKENGFLALVSYDYNKKDLFVASKSLNRGDYVGYINNILEENGLRKKLLQDLQTRYDKGESKTYIFECIDPINDPHIIKYSHSELVLLDIVNNDLVYKTSSNEDIIETSKRLGIRHKELIFIINNFNEFYNIYLNCKEESFKLDGEYIEGFVFVDAKGFMTKLKTGYYNKWKKLRKISQTVLKDGRLSKTSSLTDDIDNLFYGFCKKIHKAYYDKETKKIINHPTDIISLRDEFFKELNN